MNSKGHKEEGLPQLAIVSKTNPIYLVHIKMTNNSNNTIAGRFCNDGWRMDKEHITELSCQGIEVNDYNKALLDNVEMDLEAQGPSCEGGSRLNLNWDAPMTCPQVADGHFQKRGEWRHHSWEDINDYDELDLWMMCFPWKALIIEVMLPEIYLHLEKKTKIDVFTEFIQFL